MTALLGVGACSAGSTSSSQATPSPAGNTQAGGAPQATGPIVPGHSTLHWHSCAGTLGQEGVPDCTMLSVPVDYAKPGGRHISLALDMIPATAPKSQQQGILLVNPGGPGGSGLSLAVEVAQGLSPAVAARYDIVGFDPRGVGSSVPALSCDPGFFSGPRPNYIPANAAAEQVLISRAKTYATDCEQEFGWLLPHMTTEDVARDMDAIRAAFGVSKINYYAFSYGTYIGQVYATLFPDRVRRMVLDSVVDPTGVWYADNVDQDYAFQGRMKAFFAWVAKYDGTYHLGRTAAQVQAAWYRARNQLLAHPVNADDRRRRIRRHVPAGRLPRPALARVRAGPVVLPERRAERRPDHPVPGERDAGRERVRRLQRGAVLRRQLAPQLVFLDLGYRTGLPARPRSRPGTTPGSTPRARSGR